MSASSPQPRESFALDVICLDAIDVTDTDRERIAEYLAGFADTRHEEGEVMDCPGCDGRVIFNQLSIIMGLGGLRWGVVNGEAMCVSCDWPWRAYHSVRLDSGKFLHWTMLMPAMPVEVFA